MGGGPKINGVIMTNQMLYIHRNLAIILTVWIFSPIIGIYEMSFIDFFIFITFTWLSSAGIPSLRKISQIGLSPDIDILLGSHRSKFFHSSFLPVFLLLISTIIKSHPVSIILQGVSWGYMIHIAIDSITSTKWLLKNLDIFLGFIIFYEAAKKILFVNA